MNANMSLGYIGWALIGMAGYSLTTLFMKLAMRAGAASSFTVLIVAVSIVFASTILMVTLRGEWGALSSQFSGRAMLWSCATGIVLAIAVISLFRALSFGPASVVVPIYGMFIVGGAILGLVFLHEPLTWRKAAGIAAAVLGVYLIAG
jgi:transporter family protein